MRPARTGRHAPGGWGFAVRLAVAVSSLIVGACCLLSWFLVQRDLAEINRGVVDRGRTIVENLAHDAELSMLSGDVASLRLLGNMARAQRDVLYCRFLDGDDHPIAMVGGPPRDASVVEVTDMSGAIAVGADVWEFRAPIFTTNLRPRREELEFLISDAAPSGDSRQQLIGTVTVGVAVEPLRAHAWQSFGAAAAFTALVAFAAIISAIFWARAVTRPLQALARAADAIARGEFATRVHIDTRDELAAVGQSFNEMVLSLTQSHTTLAEYSRTLEIRSERLAGLNDQLEEANRLKSEFLATVSHELRTPLNVILGYTGMLVEGAVGPVTAEQREMLQAIERYSTTQLDLIKNVLDFTRLTSGKISFQVERFALAPMLADVIGVHAHPGAATAVALRAAVADDVPELETDRVKLQEVIRNLVDNAVKFTVQGSVTVTATLEPSGTAVAIEVSDTGIGIPVKEIGHIFEEFRQVGESSTRATKGVGLGLSIVKRLVTALGGTITVSSRPVVGSTFRVTVPVVLARPQDAADAAEASETGAQLTGTG